jgi:hypothetical protein
MTLPNRMDVPGDHPHLHGDPILRSFDDGKRRVFALGGLHYLSGNRRPFFSLTMASWRRERGRWVEDEFGCAHEELLHLWPDLAPLAALHLSDDDGQPMHATENGFYWLAGYAGGAGQRYHGGNGTPEKSREECLEVWARLVRLPLEDARREVDSLVARAEVEAARRLYQVEPGVTFANAARGAALREMHARWIEDQRERWREDARACIEALGIPFYYGDRLPAETAA